MLIKKENFKRYFYVFSTLMLALLLIIVSNNILFHLGVIITLVVLVILVSKLNFSHPYFWFSVFFFLYNCAYMVIITIEPNDILANGYNKQSSILIVIGLGITLLSIGTRTHLYDYKKLAYPEKYNFDLSLIKYFFVILLLILLFCIVVLQIQGVTSKSEQWISHNIFWVVGTYCTRFITFIVSLRLFINIDKLGTKKMILVASLLIGVFSLMTGERDALLRLLIILILGLAMLNILRGKHLIIIAPLGMAVMIIMNYLKYFFSTGELNKSFLSNGNLLYAFLYSDFADSGSNLQVLLSQHGLEGSQGYSVIFKDVLSSVVPSNIMNSLFGGITNWNVSEWYNDYFYRGSTWNRAFTLIGEGYLIDGVIGVVVLFLLVGLLIKWMYKKSGSSPYYAALYIYGVASIVASFRGDIASILSGIIRIPVFFIIITWLIKETRIIRK